MKWTILFIVSLITGINSISAQWEQTNGPYRTTCYNYINLGIDTVLVGGGGVYLTTNGGDNWIPFYNGITSTTFVKSFTKLGSQIFMASNDGVYKLLNHNNLWVQANLGLPDYVLSLAADSTKIFAGTSSGVYLSNDYGDSWVPVNSGLPDEKRISTLAIQGSMVFAGISGKGVYASNINSMNWVEKNDGFVGSRRITEIVTFNNILYLGSPGSLGSYGVGLYKSTDEGNNWTLLTDVGGGVSQIEVSNQYICFSTNSEGFFYSSDDGNTWQQVNSGLPSKNIWSLHMNNTNVFVGCYNHGNYTAEIPPVTWKQKNIGLPITKNFNIASSGTSLFVGTWSAGLFRYNPIENNHWDYEKLTAHSISHIECTNGNIFFSVSGGTVGNFGVYLSIDDGASWEYIKETGSNGVYALAANMQTVIICEFGEFNQGRISLSTDSGYNWSDITSGISINYDVSTLFVTDTSIFVALENDLYFSDDYGVNWELRNSGIPISSYSNSFIEHDGLIFTTTSEGVYYTSNYGIEWLSANNGLTNMDASCFAHNDTSIFVGTSGGIFVSTDSGDNWIEFNEGFPQYTKVESLAIFDGYLFATTWEDGIWKRDLSNPNGINIKPKEKNAVKVYPNPASGRITIEIDHVPRKYTVEIISLSGYVIKEYECTNNIEVINISDLKTGLYIIKTITRKVISVDKFIKQ